MNSTWIHPEAYPAAEHYLRKLSCTPEDIGTTKLRNKCRKNPSFVEELSTKYDTDSLNLIKRAFEMDEENIRVDNNYDFRRSVQKEKVEIKVGLEVNGLVTNIAGFGAFVSLGADKDGLLHNSKMRNRSLIPNQKIKVRVEAIKDDGKISLVLAE